MFYGTIVKEVGCSLNCFKNVDGVGRFDLVGLTIIWSL